MNRVCTLIATLTVVLFACTGCVSPVDADPSFDISLDDAREQLKEIRADRQPLERPLVISGGYLDPGSGVHRVITRFRTLTSTPELVASTPYFSVWTFDSARRRLVELVEDRFPSDDPEWTSEVDVLGISMGGLVARYAALDNGGEHKRLRIRTLFTLSTPHKGADLASLPTVDPKALSMRKGSPFIASIRDSTETIDYELLPYVRLGDGVVGCENCAPDGYPVRWIPNESFGFSHLGIQDDPRLTLEIIRRLRGEKPVSGEPSPLPVE